MAKNNLFLGSGSGSVGDVVLMRRNGQQVARVRIREIANPKSEGQSVQRSVFAPVSKFYAPLSGVLEKSWEGKNRADSQAAFLKANINLGRANNWALPKGFGFAPLPYQIANGTLPSLPQTFGNTNNLVLQVPALEAGATTFGQLSQALIAQGYAEGDQLTLIIVLEQAEGQSLSYVPRYTRVYLDSTSGDTIAEAFALVTTSVAAGTLTLSRPDMFGAAMIVSRYDRGNWRRSVTYMQCDPTYMEGVVRDSMLAARSYQSDQSTPVSDVYLNGAAGDTEAPALLPVITRLEVAGVRVNNGETKTIEVPTAGSWDASGIVSNIDSIGQSNLSVCFDMSGTITRGGLSSDGEFVVSSLNAGTYRVYLAAGTAKIGNDFATITIVEA